MPTTLQVSDIVRKVQEQLKTAEAKGVYLKVSGERLDDDWLYIEVIPTNPGFRASDHDGVMTRTERKLRAEGIDQVLLQPVIDD